jgi:hypothetical protein
MFDTIRRTRLLNQMTDLLRQGHLFINAPAGYGKTMLLQSLQTERPYSYLIPLTPADSDPAALAERLEPLRQPENCLLLDDAHHLLAADGTIHWLQTADAPAAPALGVGRTPTPLPAHRSGPLWQNPPANMVDLAFNDREAQPCWATGGQTCPNGSDGWKAGHWAGPAEKSGRNRQSAAHRRAAVVRLPDRAVVRRAAARFAPLYDGHGRSPHLHRRPGRPPTARQRPGRPPSKPCWNAICFSTRMRQTAATVTTI